MSQGLSGSAALAIASQLAKMELLEDDQENLFEPRDGQVEVLQSLRVCFFISYISQSLLLSPKTHGEQLYTRLKCDLESGNGELLMELGIEGVSSKCLYSR